MTFSCTICTDIFVSSDDIHVTPCGHAFHYACILQWLERSKSCPECRNKCIAKSLTKVYLNYISSADNSGDNATLLQNLDNVKLSLREKETKLKKLEESQESHKAESNKMKKVISSLEGKIKGLDCVISTLKNEIGKLRIEKSQFQTLKEEMKKMGNKMQLMKTIEFAISSTSKEIKDLVASNSNPQTLAVLVTSLKRELQASEFKRNELRDRIKSCQSELHKERAKCNSNPQPLAVLVTMLKRELQASEFKRNELRNRIKSCQSDLHKERGKCRMLEYKLTAADSEIYKLQGEVEALGKRTADGDSHSDASVIINTPDQPTKRKRKIIDLDMNKSTPLEDEVRNIIESDSPYLPIKASAFGLYPPISRKGLSAIALSKHEHIAKRTPTKAYSDLSNKYYMSRDPRPSDYIGMPSSLASARLAEPLKKENVPSTTRIVKINRNANAVDDLMLLDF